MELTDNVFTHDEVEVCSSSESEGSDALQNLKDTFTPLKTAVYKDMYDEHVPP